MTLPDFMKVSICSQVNWPAGGDEAPGAPVPAADTTIAVRHTEPITGVRRCILMSFPLFSEWGRRSIARMGRNSDSTIRRAIMTAFGARDVPHSNSSPHAGLAGVRLVGRDGAGVFPGVARRIALGRQRAPHAPRATVGRRFLAHLVRRRRHTAVLSGRPLGVLAAAPRRGRRHTPLPPGQYLSPRVF